MTWQTFLNHLLQLATSFGLKLIAAIVVLSVGVKLISWVCKLIRKSPRIQKLEDSFESFLTSFIKIALYAVLFITIAMILGVPATSFLTILASCGVAIGLALQGSLSNFAGGLMILFFKPFEIGDYIEADGKSGTVVDISVVYTTLLTPDRKRITMPNGTLTNSSITNYSKEDLRRVDLTFTVGYESSDEAVKSAIKHVVDTHPLTLDTPAPLIRLSQHGDSALVYVAKVWCKNADYWTVYFDITEGVKAEFDKNGISIPYPQVDVHIKNS